MDTEMQRGMLPGAMALSAKFVPVVQQVSRKTLEAVKEFVADPKALTDKVRQQAVKSLSCQAAHSAIAAHVHLQRADALYRKLQSYVISTNQRSLLLLRPPESVLEQQRLNLT